VQRGRVESLAITKPKDTECCLTQLGRFLTMGPRNEQQRLREGGGEIPAWL
jgi:hypothetical protein